MIIRINQIAVDFTLEKEKTLADLTSSLRAWATAQNLAILGILADGKALGPDDATPLTGLKVIDVEAVPVGERDLARIAVMARFFALLSHAWESGDRQLTLELHQEYPSVRSAVVPLLDPLAGRLRGPLEVLDGPWDNSEALGAASARLAREIEGRRKELQAPAWALSQTMEHMAAAVANLGELAVLFQKGQDKDAFERILSLFLVLEEGTRRAELYLRDHPERASGWKEHHDGLQPFLKETEQALASGDFILLTDLLEYEVIPRLQGFKNLFPEVSNLDPVSEVL